MVSIVALVTAILAACGGAKDESQPVAAALSAVDSGHKKLLTPGAGGERPTSPPPAAPASSPISPKPAGIEVDTTSLPVPQSGVSIAMLTPPGAIPPAAMDRLADGAFRLLCNWSKMAFDDPIVYPGQPGVSHHHTFFGNTEIDATTTSDNIRSKGMASCRGGTINLSGYWMPSMIDTATNKPVAPNSLLVYYKTGLWTYMNDGSVIQPLPKGLKMIAGTSSNATAAGRFRSPI